MSPLKISGPWVASKRQSRLFPMGSGSVRDPGPGMASVAGGHFEA